MTNASQNSHDPISPATPAREQQVLQHCLAQCPRNLLNKTEQALFESRLQAEFSRLYQLYNECYGHRFDFYYQLENLVTTLHQGFANRPRKLRETDKLRQANTDWFQRENMLGMAVYVDLFAGDLSNLHHRIPYLKELGITYLHLMPLYDAPEAESDGGYAVSDYRKVNPALGNMDELTALADALREAGISLVLDFVFNHTSDEHRWAKAAQEGVPEYQEYYYMFPDRTLPDQYEHSLREIFPQIRRGSFTFNQASQKWVWTTFNNFQWDLNYSNPAVFNAITDEMLFLANIGCEALRLDALAFIWKEMGTNCENQPKAHSLIQAFNACLQIVAPAVLFKSEAIVHPDEVLKYIDPQECQLSYNPLMMALLWESLATRKTELLTESLRKSFSINPHCAWVNYVRCHDDIGWTFDDAVAQQLGINGFDHRFFLNQYYTGRFEGSFSRGVPFQENPTTGDCRVCGTAASLTGLELAVWNNNPHEIDHAIKRHLLLHSIILSIGGIPLLYSGDELGFLNDYRYEQDPGKAHDSRWVNRIALTDELLAHASKSHTPQYRIAQGLKNMIAVRKQTPALGLGDTRIIQTDNQHIFAYSRSLHGQQEFAGNKNSDSQSHFFLALANFSEHSQQIDRRILNHLFSETCTDLLNGQTLSTNSDELKKPIELEAYQVVWLGA